MRAIDPDTRAAFVGIQHLIAGYWNEVDANDARGAPNFYTDTSTFEPGTGKVYQGRAGIAAFYEDRAKRGKRTTRHFALNLTITLETADRANGHYLIAHYAADGPEPITDTAAPCSIGAIDCIFERGADGHWRFAKVQSTPIFIGAEPYVRAALMR